MATENNSEPQIRTYVLANPEARKNYNLRQYKSLITDVIHEYLPDAEVSVNESSYTVDGITKGAAIKVGRQLSKHFDDDAFLIRSCLFISSKGTSYKNDFKPVES